MMSFFLMLLSLISPSTSASIQPVKWSLQGARTRSVTAGAIVPIAVKADIATGWHIYSLSQKPGGPIPMRIKVESADDVSIRGRIGAPQPHRVFDKNFGIETEVYSGVARFTIPVGVPRNSLPGVRKFRIEARYQVCSDRLCLPAHSEKFDVQLQVARNAR